MLTLAVLLLLAVPTLALDPADSWLVYAKAAGKGSKVLSVNASWKVPAYPTTRDGGNAPGWWFGIEPVPADVLVQPILAYGDGSPDYMIFTGFYVRVFSLPQESPPPHREKRPPRLPATQREKRTTRFPATPLQSPCG